MKSIGTEAFSVSEHRDESAGDDERVRVLHVVESFGGGVAAAVRDYARSTPEWDHHLVCRLRPEAASLDEGWVSDFTSVRAITGGHVTAVRRVRSELSRIAPQVVHSHSSYAGVWARLATLGSRAARTVHTPHAWSFERQDRSPLQRFAYRIVERALLHRTDVLAGCSRAEIQAVRSWRADPCLVYVPNVAVASEDGAGSHPLREWDPVKGPLMVGSGRLTGQKDPVWFCDAVRSVRSSGRPLRALWIGGGDVLLQRELEAEGIEVTGWISPEAARRALAEADLYLHTARWEGFPITVLEAALLGRPTLVREISAFAGLGLPLTLARPEDLLKQWDRLSDLQTRRAAVRELGAALWENTAATQRERLIEAYGRSSTAASAVGRRV